MLLQFGSRTWNNSGRLELLQYKAILYYNSGRSVITNEGNFYYNSSQNSEVLHFRAGLLQFQAVLQFVSIIAIKGSTGASARRDKWYPRNELDQLIW